MLDPEDSVISDHIYGPDRPLLQGGMKRRRNKDQKFLRIYLPTDILLHHKNIKIYFDFF